MNQENELIIVTMMTPQGATGVQSHFNAILHEASKQGLKTRLVTPFNTQVILARKAAGLITKLLRPVDQEWMTLWNRWSHYLLVKYQLNKLLHKNKNSVIIYTQDPLSSKAALQIKKNHRIVTVVHFNISEANEALVKNLTTVGGRLYRHLLVIEAQTLPEVDKIIFVSSFMQTVVNDRLPLLKSVPQVILANFIEDASNQKPKLNVKGDLITIGSLESRKNQAFILRVLAKAHDRGYRYRLTIIGDGPDRVMLEKLASQLKLDGSVTFLGTQTNAAAYLASHRVYVHSALMESFGITLVEAMSYSLPVLAPAVGGISEVFVDGQQGFFWPLDNLDTATDTLCGILENKTLYHQLSKNARARFETKFSANVLAKSWIGELTDSF